MDKFELREEIEFIENRINLLNKKIEENKEIGFVNIVGYDKDGIWSEERPIEQVEKMIEELKKELKRLQEED